MTSSIVLSALLHNLLDTPFDLEFAVTNRCNLKCIQCNIWRHYEEKPESAEEELSVERIARIFSSYGGFSVIGITGGEPHLRGDLPQILDIIASTQKSLTSLFITTNGQLCDVIAANVREMLKRMDRYATRFELTHLVSIDGPRELHDEIRGVIGAHEKALRTLRLLVELATSYPSFHVGTVTVCSPFNINRMSEVLDHVSELKEGCALEPSFCVWFQGQLYKNIERYENLKVEEFRQRLIDYVPRMKSIVGSGSAISIGRSIFYDLLSLWLRNPSSQVVPCGAARIRYFLDPYGSLYPCTIFNHKAGVLVDFDDDLRKLFLSDARMKVRKLVEDEKCPICCNTCETIPAMMVKPIHTTAKWLESRLFQEKS